MILSLTPAHATTIAYTDRVSFDAVVGGTTLLTFDTEAFDTDTMHSTSSNTGRITINTSGTYMIDMNVRFPSATYTEFKLNMRSNSGGSAVGGTSVFLHYAAPTAGSIIHLHRRVNLALTSGNYYEFFVTQTSGGSRTTTTGNNQTGVTFHWLCT